MRKKHLIILMIVLLISTGCQSKKNKNEINVGIIRVPNDTVVAIQMGYFEEAFKEYDVKLNFKFFDSGVAMNQAFTSGSLDFAEMGYTNGIVAQAKNLDVSLFWIHEIIGTNEALVVNDSSIREIADLKGKKIATIFSSTSHYSLLKALELNDLTSNDVTLLNMETAEIVAAWQRGDLDAAYTWEPTLSKIQTVDNTLITSKDLMNKGQTTANIGLVRNSFANEHPEYVNAFIKGLDQAYQLYKTNPDSAIKAAADYLELDKSEAQKQMEGTQWLSVEELASKDYLGDNGNFRNIFKETAEYWYELEFISKDPSKEEIDRFINVKYIEKYLGAEHGK